MSLNYTQVMFNSCSIMQICSKGKPFCLICDRRIEYELHHPEAEIGLRKFFQDFLNLIDLPFFCVVYSLSVQTWRRK